MRIGRGFGVSNPDMTAQEAFQEAMWDANTLVKAQTIKNDPMRLTNAKKALAVLAAEEQAKLEAIVGVSNETPLKAKRMRKIISGPSSWRS